MKLSVLGDGRRWWKCFGFAAWIRTPYGIFSHPQRPQSTGGQKIPQSPVKTLLLVFLLLMNLCVDRVQCEGKSFVLPENLKEADQTRSPTSTTSIERLPRLHYHGNIKSMPRRPSQISSDRSEQTNFGGGNRKKLIHTSGLRSADGSPRGVGGLYTSDDKFVRNTTGETNAEDPVRIAASFSQTGTVNISDRDRGQLSSSSEEIPSIRAAVRHDGSRISSHSTLNASEFILERRIIAGNNNTGNLLVSDSNNPPAGTMHAIKTAHSAKSNLQSEDSVGERGPTRGLAAASAARGDAEAELTPESSVHDSVLLPEPAEGHLIHDIRGIKTKLTTLHSATVDSPSDEKRPLALTNDIVRRGGGISRDQAGRSNGPRHESHSDLRNTIPRPTVHERRPAPRLNYFMNEISGTDSAGADYDMDKVGERKERARSALHKRYTTHNKISSVDFNRAIPTTYQSMESGDNSSTPNSPNTGAQVLTFQGKNKRDRGNMAHKDLCETVTLNHASNTWHLWRFLFQGICDIVGYESSKGSLSRRDSISTIHKPTIDGQSPWFTIESNSDRRGVIKRLKRSPAPVDKNRERPWSKFGRKKTGRMLQQASPLSGAPKPGEIRPGLQQHAQRRDTGNQQPPRVTTTTKRPRSYTLIVYYRGTSTPTPLTTPVLLTGSSDRPTVPTVTSSPSPPPSSSKEVSKLCDSRNSTDEACKGATNNPVVVSTSSDKQGPSSPTPSSFSEAGQAGNQDDIHEGDGGQGSGPEGQGHTSSPGLHLRSGDLPVFGSNVSSKPRPISASPSPPSPQAGGADQQEPGPTSPSGNNHQGFDISDADADIRESGDIVKQQSTSADMGVRPPDPTPAAPDHLHGNTHPASPASNSTLAPDITFPQNTPSKASTNGRDKVDLPADEASPGVPAPTAHPKTDALASPGQQQGDMDGFSPAARSQRPGPDAGDTSDSSQSSDSSSNSSGGGSSAAGDSGLQSHNQANNNSRRDTVDRKTVNRDSDVLSTRNPIVRAPISTQSRAIHQAATSSNGGAIALENGDGGEGAGRDSGRGNMDSIDNPIDRVTPSTAAARSTYASNSPLSAIGDHQHGMRVREKNASPILNSGSEADRTKTPENGGAGQQGRDSITYNVYATRPSLTDSHSKPRTISPSAGEIGDSLDDNAHRRGMDSPLDAKGAAIPGNRAPGRVHEMDVFSQTTDAPEDKITSEDPESVTEESKFSKLVDTGGSYITGDSEGYKTGPPQVVKGAMDVAEDGVLSHPPHNYHSTLEVPPTARPKADTTSHHYIYHTYNVPRPIATVTDPTTSSQTPTAPRGNVTDGAEEGRNVTESTPTKPRYITRVVTTTTPTQNKSILGKKHMLDAPITDKPLFVPPTSTLLPNTSLSPGAGVVPSHVTLQTSAALSSGEVAGIVAGCIVGFWIVLGPIVCIICRMRDRAKSKRREREREDSMSHALVEEMIRMELARGRAKMYRTAITDERELERLPVSEYALGATCNSGEFSNSPIRKSYSQHDKQSYLADKQSETETERLAVNINDYIIKNATTVTDIKGSSPVLGRYHSNNHLYANGKVLNGNIHSNSLPNGLSNHAKRKEPPHVEQETQAESSRPPDPDGSPLHSYREALKRYYAKHPPRKGVQRSSSATRMGYMHMNGFTGGKQNTYPYHGLPNYATTVATPTKVHRPNYVNSVYKHNGDVRIPSSKSKASPIYANTAYSNLNTGCPIKQNGYAGKQVTDTIV